MSKELPTQNIDILSITTLDEIAVGVSCVIVESSLPTTLRTRLEEMGLTRGAQVTVLKLAPLGDPMQICVRGYALCIRRETAKNFIVKVTHANLQ